MDIYFFLFKYVIKNEFFLLFIVIYNKININVFLYGMSFFGFLNLNGFFLFDDDEFDLEELREFDRLGMLRLFLFLNVSIIFLLLDELIELFSDCIIVIVVVLIIDLVVVI